MPHLSAKLEFFRCKINQMKKHVINISMIDHSLGNKLSVVTIIYRIISQNSLTQWSY